MENEFITAEITEIVKKMSTENQQYFLTLVRVAAAAEKAVKNDERFNDEKKINAS